MNTKTKSDKTAASGADRLRAYRQRRKAAGLPDGSKANAKAINAASRKRRRAAKVDGEAPPGL